MQHVFTQKIGHGTGTDDCPGAAFLVRYLVQNSKSAGFIGRNITDSISEIKLDQWPRIITVSDQATMNDVLQYTPAFTINSSLDIYQRVPYYGGLKRLELSDSDLMFSVGYIHNTKTPISPAAEDLLNAISGMLTPERTEIGAK